MNLFGLTANLIDAGMLIFGKTGKILNARRNRYCFIIDIICLCYWIYMNVRRGLFSQVISAVVSIMIYSYAFYNWGKVDIKHKEN